MIISVRGKCKILLLLSAGYWHTLLRCPSRVSKIDVSVSLLHTLHSSKRPTQRLIKAEKIGSGQQQRKTVLNKFSIKNHPLCKSIWNVQLTNITGERKCSEKIYIFTTLSPARWVGGPHQETLFELHKRDDHSPECVSCIVSFTPQKVKF